MKRSSGRLTRCKIASGCPQAIAAVCTLAISRPCATISVRCLFHATHWPAYSTGAGGGICEADVFFGCVDMGSTSGAFYRVGRLKPSKFCGIEFRLTTELPSTLTTLSRRRRSRSARIPLSHQWLSRLVDSPVPIKRFGNVVVRPKIADVASG